MDQKKPVSYQEIHRYMLRKTQEYYACPPRVLVQAVLAEYAGRGEQLTEAEAEKLVSLIDIQRYIKAEMKAIWPEFMSAIPENGLKER